MSFVCKCDKCGTVYERGFNGSWKKSIEFGKETFSVVFETRKPHLCKKCLFKFLTIFQKEVQDTYND